MAKRIRFLRVVKSELQLSNVDLLEQDVTAEHRAGRFDTVLARAVAPSAKLWPMLEPALNHGARMVVFSSTQENSADPKDQGGVEKTEYRCRTERIAVPDIEQPHVLEILERR
jgi:16S rRNA G527 N7-methylase RsmG